MRATKVFLYSAVVILFITALAKLGSSCGHSGILRMYDPLLGIQFRDTFRIAGLVEMAVAVFCYLNKRLLLSLGIMAWLATSFAVYRLGLIMVGYQRPCPCLGNFTDALHIAPEKADLIMKFILTYLLIGSYFLLLWGWRKRKKSTFLAT